MLNFEDLYETYVTDVYRFAYWLAGNSTEAEDITSETFVRAWVKRDDIRTETLKAYLFTIARNVYLGYRRKNRHHVALEDDHPDPAPTPDRWVESRLELQMVQSVLQTLPEIDRAAFIMRIQHELPYVEIARALELSVSAARVKVHRVRKKVAHYFCQKGGFLNMEVTRNVILDLLPLYLADEASEDSRTLVESFLDIDPELAEMAKKPEITELPDDIPISLTKEDKLEAFREAKRLMFLRTVILATIISGSIIVVLLIVLAARAVL